MYKLIALDLDGTLLDSKGNISDFDSEILGRFREAGGTVVLASGRMTACVSPFALKLGFDCPLITYNGAMVRTGSSENAGIIFHRPLNDSFAGYIVDYCEEKGFLLNYYLDDVLYASGCQKLRKYAGLYSSQTGAVYNFIPSLKDFKGRSPTKLILITDPVHSDVSRTRDFQYEHFCGMMGKDLNIVKTNPEYLEFIHCGVDKGKGLGKLAEFCGIGKEEIIAFGDGDNDVEMLKFAGFSVAPSNASVSAKKAADRVIDLNNDQSAVGVFLSEILK